MYGWGGYDNFNRGGYSYDDAKRGYLDALAKDAAKKGPRTYSKSAAGDWSIVNPKGKAIASDSANPIVIGVDVTGSMSDWPAEIFDRLPLMYQTLSQYRDDVELSFNAIGDAHSDSYPLQVNDFKKGIALEDAVKAIICEGGGGGQVSESYELFGHFMKERCKTPNATSPFLFIFGDEKFYETVNPAQVKHYVGDTLQSSVSSAAVWDGLQQRFNLYLLHKPYGNGGDMRTDKEVVDHWAAAIGKERIVELPSKERAVDILVGIVAKHWGQYGDFSKNMGARQPDAEVASVHKSLRYLPLDKAPTSVLGGIGQCAGKGAKSVRTSKATRSLSEMFNDAKK